MASPFPFDVFQQGLRRGSAHLPHDPVKAYAYVEHPTEKWRVYLRSCLFLHIEGSHDMTQFLVVKRRGAHMSSAAWEPPKGQMEGKDLHANRSILQNLTENVLRETEEESHISQVSRLRHTGLIFQSQESNYPPHHFFQYHIFQGIATPEQIKQSANTFQWIKMHPKGFARWRRDRREKDAMDWFHPRRTRLNPRWTPSIEALYLQHSRR